MSQQIASFPFWEIRFDERANADAALSQACLTGLAESGVTDLFVCAHDWNDDPSIVRVLYERFFHEVEREFDDPRTARRGKAKIGIVGLLWPGTRWADEPVPGADTAIALTDRQLLDRLKPTFPGYEPILDQLAGLLEQRPTSNIDELKNFYQLTESLATPADGLSAGVEAAEDEGEFNGLFGDDPQSISHRFASALPRQPGARITKVADRLWDGAKCALRQTTYWIMKQRAGFIGKSGLGPFLVQLSHAQVAAGAVMPRIHLVGHSYGARLVAYSLLGVSTPLPPSRPLVKSVFLLQASFSHFAFARSLPMDPRTEGALARTADRVDGPIVVTYSSNDRALAIDYPLASLTVPNIRSASDELLFAWGALGSDGAQEVNARTVKIRPPGHAHPFGSAKFVNLDASDTIKSHDDIVHARVAWAMLDTARLLDISPPSMLLQRGTVSEALRDPDQRSKVGMPVDDATAGPVIVELNMDHAQGLSGARDRFKDIYEKVLNRKWTDHPGPMLVTNSYYRCMLSVAEIRSLVDEDQRVDQGAGSAEGRRRRSIYRVWPDFPVRRTIDRSVATVKADAALRSYNASGAKITWAVIDSGIDANHPHFKTFNTLRHPDIALLHRDFTLPQGQDVNQSVESALNDPYGHGTHVAGIIAGGLFDGTKRVDYDLFVCERVAVSEEMDLAQVQEREEEALAEQLSGIAPRCNLVSLRVLDANGACRSSDVMRALQYVREELNGQGKRSRVHGVNLSLGYEFNAKWHACGQSPVCVEVDRLVRSGVVVVISAGNTGYGDLTSNKGLFSTGLSLTINDPGNASLAITVGATHRDSPYTYGVSYFSSKGPTSDGRLKPELVAPGERITSCAAGKNLGAMKPALEKRKKQALPSEQAQGASEVLFAPYIEDSGTSMAAPHVSGAIAAFLSIRREFIGRPEEIKRIFLQTATSLGRERYFEGHGLLDLMRAIQSV
jgi:subtilisin family serine protease